MWKLASLALLAILAASPLIGAQAPKPTKEAPPAPVSPIAYEGSTITALKVKDLKAASAWYGKILGAQPFYALEEAGWAELSGPVPNALIGLSQIGAGESVATNGGSTLSFGVKDMAKAKEWLVKNQVALVGDVVEIPQTVKLLSFRDPDGNTLMFYEPWKGQ